MTAILRISRFWCLFYFGKSGGTAEKPGSVDFTSFFAIFPPVKGCKNIITCCCGFENTSARNNAALVRYKSRYWNKRATRENQQNQGVWHSNELFSMRYYYHGWGWFWSNEQCDKIELWKNHVTLAYLKEKLTFYDYFTLAEQCDRVRIINNPKTRKK